MLKALLKKELLQLNSFYFIDKKKNKNRTKSGTIFMFILFGFLFLAVAASFLGMSFLYSDAFILNGYSWLYFSMMGMISILAGFFGDVFNTYSSIYKSKDNDLILAMPIKSSTFLLSKIVGVLIMGALYSSLAFIPATIVYWIKIKTITVSTVVLPLLVFPFVVLFVASLTLLIGFLVALVSSKISHKTFVTVISTLFFVGVYYFVYFRLSSLLQSSASNPELLSYGIKKYFYPFYHLGLAGSGSISSFFIFLSFSLICFLLVYFLMSKTLFSTITSSSSTSTKKKVKQGDINLKSIHYSLMMKELKRFINCPAYLLNSGLGLIIMVFGSVALLIKKNSILSLLSMLNPVIEIYPWINSCIPVALLLLTLLLCSTCTISTPSISLEGKSIWILQSLPVNEKDIIFAKEKFHICICTIPTVLLNVVMSYVFNLSFTLSALLVITSVLFVCLFSSLGLVINLLKPNLTWANEIVPIKQDIGIAIMLFGGWALAIAIGGIFYLARQIIKPEVYLALISIVFAIVIPITNRWLKTKGTLLFRYL